MTRKPLAAIGGALLLAAGLRVPAGAQELKPWKHGVIEPKGDAGFHADGRPARLRRQARPQARNHLA